MSEEMRASFGIPLDSDGFVRRECPTCEREFKWHISDDEDEAADVPVGGYFCPYCAVQSSVDAWFTQEQLEVAQAVAIEQIVDPMLRKTAKKMGGRYEKGRRDPVPDLDDVVDDMRRVDFACHPAEPVKVANNWDRPVTCLVCGSSRSA